LRFGFHRFLLAGSTLPKAPAGDQKGCDSF
jgi:hypothetical protein